MSDTDPSKMDTSDVDTSTTTSTMISSTASTMTSSWVSSLVSSSIPSSTSSSSSSSTSTLVSSSFSLPSGTGARHKVFLPDYVLTLIQLKMAPDFPKEKIDEIASELVKFTKMPSSSVLKQLAVKKWALPFGETIVEENNSVRYVTACPITTTNDIELTVLVNKPPNSDFYFKIPDKGDPLAAFAPIKLENKNNGFKALNESALIRPVWSDPSDEPTFSLVYAYLNGVPKVDHFKVDHGYKGGLGDDDLYTAGFAWQLTQYCPYNPDKPDDVGEERFIFTGHSKDPKNKHPLQGYYMPLEALQTRVGTGNKKVAENDLNLLAKGDPLYTLWYPDGRLVEAYKLRALFNPMEPRKTISSDESSNLRHLFLEHCKLARLARLNEGLYDVLSRFWDSAWEPELILKVNDTWRDQIRMAAAASLKVTYSASDKDKHLTTIVESRTKEWLFRPKITIVESAPTGKYYLWGTHPNDLYKLWMDSDTYLAVAGTGKSGVWLPSRPRPSPAAVVAEDEAIEEALKQAGKSTYMKGAGAARTRTVITGTSMNIVRNYKRTPDQVGAMGGTSPNELVSAWWGVKKNEKVAEWLHRSAWSYGGLSGTGGNLGPQSSQVMSNLIIGTHEANTMMIRYEIFVKRFAHYTKKPIQVTTAILQEDMRTTPDYAWYCHLLDYLVEGDQSSNPPVKFSMLFDPFSRRLPTRLELDLDELFESLAYGWDSSEFMA